MNAGQDLTLRLDATASAVLASLRAPVGAIADLAFGSLTADADALDGGHLAFLPTDALELDLNDSAQRNFGDYELRALLGKGGMGVVYRAYQRSLDREVAVKLLAAGPWASHEFIDRFRVEAQNAARMQHPNIVAIHEVGSADEMHFFSMQLVQGGSLSALLQCEGRLPVRQAAQLLRVIAEAVDYAHRLGVLHLDLKPANVLLDETGAPHVADFGLAQRFEHGLAAENNEVSGTPSYMAPEQASAGPQQITPATDIWGLGAIGFELVSGRPPFLGGTPQSTLRLVVEGEIPDVRSCAPQVPQDFAAIISRCMQRDVKRRYASGRELADDLSRFLEGRPVKARPLNAMQRIGRWARREPRLAATVLFAAGALIVGLVATSIQWRHARANATVARANATLANQRLWDARNAAILRSMESGDGWNAAPLLLANIREMETQGDHDRLANARKRLGIVENENPRLIDVWPVQPRTGAMAFSADGRLLALSGLQSGIRAYDVASGREILRIASHEGQARDQWMVMGMLGFAPDHRTLIATARTAAPDAHPGAAGMMRLDTSTRAWIDPPAAFADFVDASYSPDGRIAVLTDKDGRAQSWATDPWRPLSALRSIPKPDDSLSRLISPDGAWFAEPAAGQRIELYDTRSLVLRARVDLGDFGRSVAWAASPDSRWLALGDPAGHVVVVDTRGRQAQALQPRPFFEIRWLAFSADGRWLAASAYAGGVYLWSWPDGRLVTTPFAGNGSVSQVGLSEFVALDRARGLVLTADDTDTTALWQVASTPLEADRTEAVRVTDDINALNGGGPIAVAWDPPRGLLANVAKDRLRLERLPSLILKSGRGATLRPDTLHFDGRHLVEVEDRRVRIVDARTEQPLGIPIEFPQAPSFAELTADGATLVATCGHMLYAFDAASGKPRFAPVELANSPAHVEPSPDGRRVLVEWLQSDTHDARTVSEAANLYRLADGVRLTGPIALPGPTNDAIAFSGDGRRLLAWNPRQMSLRDGATLAPIAGPLADYLPRGKDMNAQHGYILSAAVGADRAVELVFGRFDGSLWRYEWRQYTANGASRVVPLPSNRVTAILPLPNGAGTAMLRDYGPLAVILDGNGQLHDLSDDGDDTNRFVMAVSPDGRWLARSRRDGVALFDLHSHERIANLRVALPRPDKVWQLAFSPDGNDLLARSLHNRYMVWNLTPEARPVAAIARELALRDLPLDRSFGGHAERDPDSAERAALRVGDPGPPPVPAFANATTPSFAIPARDPSTSPDSLDLGPYFTFGLGPENTTAKAGAGDYSWLPRGVQRLLGIDFDLRGGIRVSGGLRARFDLANPNPGARGIMPKGRRIEAIDLLVVIADPQKGVIRLDYVDGTSADLPIHVKDSDFGYWRAGTTVATARMAAFGTDVRDYDAFDHRAYAHVLRMANPHPERAVATLTLYAPDKTDTPNDVLAITLEPLPSQPSIPAPASN